MELTLLGSSFHGVPIWCQPGTSWGWAQKKKVQCSCHGKVLGQPHGCQQRYQSVGPVPLHPHLTAVQGTQF